MYLFIYKNQYFSIIGVALLSGRSTIACACRISRIFISIHSTRDNLIVPDTKTQFGERSFAVAGPKVWNSLPDTVKNAVCQNF